MSYKEIPFIPFLENVVSIPTLVNNPIPVFKEKLKKYGKIYQVNATIAQNIIVTNHPPFINHILQSNHRNYIKSEIQTEGLAQYIGYGLLTTNGSYWLRQRRLIQPGFHRQKLVNIVHIMNDEIDDFIEEMRLNYAKSGKAFDLSEEMMRLTFKVVAKALFSRSIDEEELMRTGEIITAVQKYFVRKARMPFMKPWYQLIGREQRTNRLKEEADALLMEKIKTRKKEDGKIKHDDLLEMLLDARYEDTNEGMSMQQVKDESAILLVAGHETSANALSWLFYLLTQNPKAQQKMVEEGNQLFQKKKEIGFNDLQQLTFTRQCVDETMRLYPPAWAIDRKALEDDEIEGYKIPKGGTVIAFLYGAHHNPNYWKNPEDFIPERFAPENITSEQKKAYFPFGGGPRLCIGNNFALMEMQIAAAKIWHHFEVELIPNQDIDLQPLVTLRPRNGIKVRIKERN